MGIIVPGSELPGCLLFGVWCSRFVVRGLEIVHHLTTNPKQRTTNRLIPYIVRNKPVEYAGAERMFWPRVALSTDTEMPSLFVME